MQCPVCDSTMVTLTKEKVPLTIEQLGNIYLCQVPVCRCYAGDHVSHQLPKRKEIYNLVTTALATVKRNLTPNEHAFLLSRLHQNRPEYSCHVVRSNVDYECFKGDLYELVAQPGYILNKQIIEKVKQDPGDRAQTPRKILCIDLVADEVESTDDDSDFGHCA